MSGACRSIFRYGVHLRTAKCVTARGAAVAVLAVGALLLVACGDDQADGGSSDLVGTRKAPGSNVTWNATDDVLTLTFADDACSVRAGQVDGISSKSTN